MVTPINIEGGKQLFNMFGKYMPNITIICREGQMDNSPYDIMLPQMFNLWGGNGARIKALKGNFFISKKGGKVFDITVENPKHMLLEAYFGGSDKVKRMPFDSMETLYFHESASNGGGEGYVFAVIEIGQKYYPNI